MITMNNVDSRAIKAIGYDPDTLVMYIEFMSGGTYEYDSVPGITFCNLMNSPSKGAYFHRAIEPHFKAFKIF